MSGVFGSVQVLFWGLQRVCFGMARTTVFLRCVQIFFCGSVQVFVNGVCRASLKGEWEVYRGFFGYAKVLLKGAKRLVCGVQGFVECVCVQGFSRSAWFSIGYKRFKLVCSFFWECVQGFFFFFRVCGFFSMCKGSCPEEAQRANDTTTVSQPSTAMAQPEGEPINKWIRH